MNCSVIICTYNRLESLQKTINGLFKQDYAPTQFEIIIVNNGDPKKIAEWIKSVKPPNPLSLRLVHESNVGVSYARNKGLRSAKGAFVIYIDDDIVPINEDWMKNLLKPFEDPKIGAVGGSTHPIFPMGEKPEEIHDRFIEFIWGAHRYDKSEKKECHYPGYLGTGNMALRKEPVLELGGFSTYLGRKGSVPLGYEDIDLCYRLEKKGFKLVTVPDADVEHVILPDRLCKEWLKNCAKWEGVSKARFEKKNLEIFPRLKKIALEIYYSQSAFRRMLRWAIVSDEKEKFYYYFRVRYAWFYFLEMFSPFRVT